MKVWLRIATLREIYLRTFLLERCECLDERRGALSDPQDRERVGFLMSLPGETTPNGWRDKKFAAYCLSNWDVRFRFRRSSTSDRLQAFGSKPRSPRGSGWANLC